MRHTLTLFPGPDINPGEPIVFFKDDVIIVREFKHYHPVNISSGRADHYHAIYLDGGYIVSCRVDLLPLSALLNEIALDDVDSILYNAMGLEHTAPPIPSPYPSPNGPRASLTEDSTRTFPIWL